MKLETNRIIKNNIYFLLGAPCSGKTTIGKMLSNKYGMYYFNGDSKRFDFIKEANSQKHPFMTKNTRDFFNWSIEEMIKWERGVVSEQTTMVIKDLEKLSCYNEKVLFEGMLDLDIMSQHVAKERVVFLTVDQQISENEFFCREDHLGLLNSILNTPDISDDEKNRRINLRKHAAIQAFNVDVSSYSVKQLTRKNETTIADMLNSVELHFKLK